MEMHCCSILFLSTTAVASISSSALSKFGACKALWLAAGFSWHKNLLEFELESLLLLSELLWLALQRPKSTIFRHDPFLRRDERLDEGGKIEFIQLRLGWSVIKLLLFRVGDVGDVWMVEISFSTWSSSVTAKNVFHRP